jgi:hypothetical protein
MVHSIDVASLTYKLGGKWYCSYPELRECHDPAMVPVDQVQIESLRMSYIEPGHMEGLPRRNSQASI